MIAVCDASPLIYLGKLGQLSLLTKLFQEIHLPNEVYNEVVLNGLRLGAIDATATNLLIEQNEFQVTAPKLPKTPPTWVKTLDFGEVQAIILAQQLKADAVLIDNRHARVAARRLGLPVKRTIGILLTAFRQKQLTLREFEWLIELIKSRPEFWISDNLCDQALAVAKQEAD